MNSRSRMITTVWLCALSLLVAGSATAVFAEGGPTFTNSNPRVLSVLEAEGWIGAEKARPVDIYVATDGAQCAGVLDVSFRNAQGRAVRASGVQILASRSDGEAFIPQALARVPNRTSRETLVVSGGADFRIEVSYQFGVDRARQAASASRIFSARVGCDTVVPLVVDVPAAPRRGEIRREGEAEAAAPARQLSVDELMSREYAIAGGRTAADEGDSRFGSATPTAETPTPQQPVAQTPVGEGPSRGGQAEGGEGISRPDSSSMVGTTCSTDSFGDDSLGGEWTISFIGDADLGSATEAGGTVQISGNGTSLYHGDDNAIFVHQSVTGDFRAETTVTGFPVDEGGGYRKAGMYVSTGTGVDDPRVFAQVVPNHPVFNTTALQFDYRDADGVAHELASSPLGISLPVDLAIDRRGNLFTVYFSTDGGATWSVPAGAAGGQVEIPVDTETMQVGLSVTSYDSGTLMTAEFDNFSLCQPNDMPAPTMPPPVICQPGRPLDVLYLFDNSGSMTFPYPGAASKLDAARNAIYAMNDLLASNLPGSRAGLITFRGNRNPEFNKNLSAQVLSGLTMDLDAIDQMAASIDVAAIDPLSTTPLATALDKTTEVLLAEHDVARLPVIVWLTDTVPNIDSEGFGPGAYRFDEISEISLLEDGAYLPWGTLAWRGNYNSGIDAYDGQVLADAVRSIIQMKSQVPDTIIFGVAIQGDEVFNEELMNFGADYTSGNVYSVDDANAIVEAVQDLVDLVDCGATVFGRVWFDMDAEGDQDTGEAGLSPVTVELVDAGGNVVGTTQTDGDGFYMFDGVPDGSYTVRVVDSTLPAAANSPTFDIDGIATAHTAAVTVANEEDVIGVDFGYTTGLTGGGPDGPGCHGDDFEDGVIGSEWMLTNVGDADQGSVAETGGALELTTDGTSLFHGDDNGAFLYQSVSGDFRAEVRFDGFPVDDGGDYRKAGLALRSGTHPDAARVMVMVVSDYADTGAPAVQFDARTEDGGTPVVLSSTVQNIGLPVHLAIERRGGEITVSVSYDGGIEWQIPAGGLGGSEAIAALEGTALVGPMAASYDAEETMTARFDDFEICLPDVTDPPDPPGPFPCEVDSPIDAIYLLDMSGSMTWEFPGMVSKFDAAQASLLQLNAAIEALDNGSRAALVTFSGVRYDPDYNIDNSVVVRSGLTTDLAGLGNVIGSLSMRNIPWYATTPVPFAIQTVTDLLNDQRDPNRAPVVYWISDQLPNIDLQGHGPREYSLDKLQEIPLRDGSGDWLPSGVVAWSGDYFGTTNAYCGQVLGDAMDTIVGLSSAQPDVRVFGVTLAGDGTGLGTYSFELNQYAAYYTNGEARLATSAEDLTLELLDILQAVNCDVPGLGTIGDRVWNDSDGDGVQDLGETGISGVTVNLLDDGGDLIATAQTDGNGNYLFTDVPPGTYTVEVDPTSLPTALDQTYDYDGLGTPHRSLVIIGQYEVNLEIDFGYEPGDITPPTPVAGCVDDDFEDGALSSVWKSALIGDATLGDAIVSGGELNVTGNGTSFFDQDNGFFVYREVNNEKFRVEVDVLGSNEGGETIYRKTGLLVTSGLGSNAKRVTIQYQPIWPDGRGSLQFRYRATAGGDGGLTWASSLVDPGQPVRIAIEKDGDTYIAEYSQDGGSTWNRAQGGAKSVVDISMGDVLLVGLTATSYSADESITGYFDDFSLCAEEVRVEEDEYCVQTAPSSEYSSSGGHALWLPGISRDLVLLDTGEFVEYSDGTAVFTGTVFDVDDFQKGFEVEVQLSGRTDDTPAGSPKQELHWSAYAPHGPVDTSTWYYYTQFSATLNGVGDWEGAVLDVTPRGPAWQVGVGANNKSIDFGASAWLYWTVLEQPSSGPALQSSGEGDFNVSLVCPEEIDSQCVSPAQVDDFAQYSGGHALWMPGIATDLVFTSNGTYTRLDNGSAVVTGRVQAEGDPEKVFDVELELFGRTDAPPPGSPSLELIGDAYFPTGSVDPSDWYYYTNFRSTLTGRGDWSGAVIELTPRGTAFQVGEGASNKNIGPGMSGWFSWRVLEQPDSGGSLASTGNGDFNMSLLCPADRSGEFCVTEAWGDQYNSSGNHAVAMPGIAKDLLFFAGEEGEMVEFADGTARFTGRVHHRDNSERIFNFVVELTGRTDTAPPGSPKKQLPSSAYVPLGPADPATWYYYSDFTATFTGEGQWDGAVVEITPRGPSWQMGVGASNKNVSFGASAWFSYQVLQQPTTGVTLRSSGNGDFNINLLDECPTDGGDGGDDGGDDGDGDDDDGAWCPRSPGFWKNHPQEWPVDSLELGGYIYAFNDLSYFLGYGGPDASTKLARALTAVRLNLESGSEADDDLLQHIADANLLLADFPPGTNPQGGDRALANAIKDDLQEQYAEECDDDIRILEDAGPGILNDGGGSGDGHGGPRDPGDGPGGGGAGPEDPATPIAGGFNPRGN